MKKDSYTYNHVTDLSGDKKPKASKKDKFHSNFNKQKEDTRENKYYGLEGKGKAMTLENMKNKYAVNPSMKSETYLPRTPEKAKSTLKKNKIK